MIQDDYGDLVEPATARSIGEQLDAGDARMTRIEADLAALRAQIAELLEYLNAVRGALKVLNWLGKLAKPLGYIVAFGAACVSFWAAVKNGVSAK